MGKINNYLKKIKSEYINPVILKDKTKIFCIGFGKTGTTSIQKAFRDLGYIVGNQSKAENLIVEYKNRHFKPIYKYCKTAEAFQDIPFSLPYLFIGLDQEFPNSKFILSVRGSAEEWYSSLVWFHSKKFGNLGDIPTKEDLINAKYRYKGFAYESLKIIYNTNDIDLYNKEKMINCYNQHIQEVKNYFRYRNEDLLILNVAQKNSYIELCSFLGKEPRQTAFPWENKTDNIK